jgi:hypothetical protein
MVVRVEQQERAVRLPGRPVQVAQLQSSGPAVPVEPAPGSNPVDPAGAVGSSLEPGGPAGPAVRLGSAEPEAPQAFSAPVGPEVSVARSPQAAPVVRADGSLGPAVTAARVGFWLLAGPAANPGSGVPEAQPELPVGRPPFH